MSNHARRLPLLLTPTLLALIAAQPAHAQFNFTTQTYPGISMSQTGSTFAPPDTMGSVGLNDVTLFNNGGFQVFNKADGTARSSLVSDATFWTSRVGISSTVTSVGLSDTRIIFDPASQRWFATEINVSNTNNQILIGRSDTADPLGTWKGTSFVTPAGGFADYPTFSLDGNGVYVGTINFTSGTGSFTGASLLSIPKADLLLSTPSISNLVSTTGNTRGFAIQGVLTNAAPQAGVQGIAIGTSLSSSSALQVTKINNPGQAGATFVSPTSLSVLTGASPSNFGPQPDGTVQLDNSDNRISGQVVKAGNFIYSVRSINVGSGTSARAGIRITIMNADASAVLAETTISDVGNNRDYSYPSIAANANGTFTIGFTRVGGAAGEFASAYARVGSFNGTAITLDSSDRLLQQGTANYHLFGGSGERWGDFSATVLDPTDSNSFWTFQEYAIASNNWGTAFSKITIVTGAPEPGTLGLALGALLPGGVVAVRRRARRTKKA